MDNNIEEGVITFAQIWRVFKKCLARAVIYAVVCAIVSFAVLYTVRSVTVDKTYSATITIKQSDENIKSTLESNKASAVAAAVSSVYGDSDNADEIYEEVLKTLVISAYVPEERASDTDYIATAYTVTFDDVDIKGVKSASQLSLLESICDNLCESYATAYAPDEIISEEVWGYAPDIENTEYLDVAYELADRLEILTESINASVEANNELSADFSTFKSTEAGSGSRSVAEILSQLDAIALTVNKVTQNIITLGIYNADAPLNGTAYADYLYTELSNEYNELGAVITEYQNQIQALEAAMQYNNTYGTVVTVDISSLLEVLTEELIPLVSEQAQIESRMNSIKSSDTSVLTYYSALATSTLAENASANADYMYSVELTLNSVLDSVDKAVDAYNALVKEYNSSTAVSVYASITKSPVTSSNSLIGMSTLLIIVIAVVLIACVVAFGQTWSAMKKAGTLDGEPENNEVKDGEQTEAVSEPAKE